MPLCCCSVRLPLLHIAILQQLDHELLMWPVNFSQCIPRSAWLS
jgi:hypothetical protein